MGSLVFGVGKCFTTTCLESLNQENLYGDESMEFVATGNATAELVATVLVPLCDWLGLYWVCENPVTWQIAVFRRSSPQKIILFI